MISSHRPARRQRNLAECLSMTTWLRTAPCQLHRSILLTLVILAGAMPACPALLARAQAQPLSQTASSQIQALLDDKAARTPAQQKIDSQLLYTRSIQSRTGVTRRVPSLRTSVHVDNQGMVLVDIKANVTSTLLQQIVAGRGQVLNSFAQYRSIRARLPLSEVEILASSPDVQFIQPAVRYKLNGRTAQNNTLPMTPSDLFVRSFNQRAAKVQAALPSLIASLPRKSAGALNPRALSSATLEEGDICERANQARATFGVNGSGVKIGVLSDSVDYLTDSQANGALGPVTVLPGQDGMPATGEGTAILEIVHALAPGASLYFATGANSAASFADNILALRAAGCDIIVDDIGYESEAPFQDDLLSQAVIQVTANGALFFSAGGNTGNLASGTASVWEGDFVDGGPATGPVGGRGGRVHAFPLPGGQTQNYDTASTPSEIDLFWDDPLGAATDDYDLFILDPTGTTVVGSSTNVQNGTQDPYENAASQDNNDQLVIVKVSGNTCFLHLDDADDGETVAIATDGVLTGHPCVPAAFCMAAVDVHTTSPFPSPFTGGAANPVENFSSDGPRHVFFNPDGSAITPGNFTHTGGFIRPKPDLSAADGVDTTVPGFTQADGSFHGTSAAGPHAAAIAALVLSANPTLTPTQMRTLLTGATLDIMAQGYDYDSGYGIVMAYPAVQSATGSSTIVLSGAVVSGSGVINPGAAVTVGFALKNVGTSATTNLVATLQPTGGVSTPSGPQSYGALSAGGPATSKPFSFVASGSCGWTITATLQLQDGQNNLGTVFVILQIGQLRNTLSQNFDSVNPPALPQGWTTTGSGPASNPNGTPWVTAAGTADTPPNAAFVPDPTDAEDDSLISPPVPINSSSAQVSFNHSFTFNAQAPEYFDGGVLEISIAGGPWTDILAAGGSFVTGGYSGTISALLPSVIAGRQAWAGSSIGFMTTIANLPASASGQTIQLRWRMGSDHSGPNTGWYVDTISITDGTACAAAQADLSVTQSVASTTTIGAGLTDIVTVTNNGPNAAAGVVLTDALPPSFTFVSATNGGTYSQATGITTWNLGTLADANITTVSLVMTPTTVQPSATNTTTVSSSVSDPNPANNTSTATITVNPAIAADFLITGLPASVRAGVASSVTVQAIDANSNPLTGYMGTITFTSSDGLAVLPSNYTFTAADNGAHTFNVTFTTPGSQTLTVSDVATAVQSTIDVTVLPSESMSLASSVNPSFPGQNVVLTAVVTATPPVAGTPTGTVIFKVSGKVIGSGSLSNGQVSTSISTLSVGSQLITATYSGNSTFGIASATLTQVVSNEAAVALVSSADPASVGQSVTFTATVTASVKGTGSPTGTMAFADGAASLGVVTLSNGQATYTTSTLAAGLHVVTAVYSGDSNFAPFTAVLLQRAGTAGTASAWGLNSTGQLGNNTTTNSSTPVPVSNLAGAILLAGGAEYSASLKQDGTVWTWGANTYGQLGNGTATSSTTPVQTENLSGVVLVTAGQNHTLALQSSGAAWAWGANANGQLGNGSTTNNAFPIQVTGLPFVLSVAGGGGHSLALADDGSVWAWGLNNDGQLGIGQSGDDQNGNPLISRVPVQVSGLSGASAIAGGGYHSLALKSDGTIWAWGSNSNGQLGNNTTTDSPVPVPVSGLTGMIAVAGGGVYSLALKSDGTIWAWGRNDAGQLGNSTTTDSSVPVQVAKLTGILAIAAGDSDSVALKSDGTVWTWGRNNYGQLGVGANSSSVPVRVSSLAQVVGIAAGSSHNLAMGSILAPPAITLTSSANPAASGQPITFTAAVTAIAPAVGTPTGAITFVDGTNILGTVALSSGQAAYSPTSLSPGIHNITAVYSGDSSFGGVSGSLTQIANGVWHPVNAAASPDGTTHVLWADGAGRADLRVVGLDGSTTSDKTFGPYPGWQATALSVAPDTTDHILWRYTDGTTSIWKLSPDGDLNYTLYGPYAGWLAVWLATASDNSDHLLWTSTDSRMSDWRIDPSGPVTYNIQGPYPGWSPISIAAAPDMSEHLLWKYTDGTMSRWRIDPSSSITYALSGPYPGWSPLSIGVGPDNLDHVLWSFTDGTMSMWHFSAQGAFTYTLYGPYSGWSPETVSVSSDDHDNVLWAYPDGTASLWNISSPGSFTYTIETPPAN